MGKAHHITVHSRVQGLPLLYTAIAAIAAGAFLVLRERPWQLQRKHQDANKADMRPALGTSATSSAASLAALQHAVSIVDPTLLPMFEVQLGLNTSESETASIGGAFAHKNPCWHNHDGNLDCLPFFHVFSPFQSGSRNLRAMMFQHPQIAPLHNPEPHFWAELRKPEDYLAALKPASAHVQSDPEHQVIGCALHLSFAVPLSLCAVHSRLHIAARSVA